MLTLTLKNYCMPLESYGLEAAAQPQALGRPGALTLALVQSGRCRVGAGPAAPPPGAGALLAGPGALVVAPGVVALAPEGPMGLAGVCLGGGAAAEAAAAMEGPLVQAGPAPGVADRILQLQEGAGRMADAEASAVAYSLLCRLAAGEGAGGVSALVAAAVAEIQEHHGEVYGVEELAAGLEVSKSHLIRCFTAEMGTSPGKYLTRVRVEAAKRLLLRADYPLDVVAGLCGFSGANYLCKVFRKETGETPAAWRRRAAPVVLPEAGALDEQIYL